MEALKTLSQQSLTHPNLDRHIRFVRYIRFILLAQMKQKISISYGSRKSGWKSRKGIRFYLICMTKDMHISSNVVKSERYAAIEDTVIFEVTFIT